MVTLTAMNQWGCADSTVDALDIKNTFRAWIPNAFTPGSSDTLNKYFGITGTGIFSYEMEIFDRWGGRVYQTKNGTPWDGSDSRTGEMAPHGIYVYIAVSTGEREGKKTLKGTVTLLR